MTPVAKSLISPIEEYTQQVDRTFQNYQLTNRGQLVVELETKLQSHLNSAPLLIINNGTIPLQIALKLLGKGGEIWKYGEAFENT
jgi:dTDP-4-amino-4,6-dideoxygalactose transaminase